MPELGAELHSSYLGHRLRSRREVGVPAVELDRCTVDLQDSVRLLTRQREGHLHQLGKWIQVIAD